MEAARKEKNEKRIQELNEEEERLRKSLETQYDKIVTLNKRRNSDSSSSSSDDESENEKMESSENETIKEIEESKKTEANEKMDDNE
jgi:hypothetical protein